MKTLTCVVLAVAAIAAIGMSSSSSLAKTSEKVRSWFFAEMLAISESYDSTRPEQISFDTQYEASRQRILAADRASRK